MGQSKLKTLKACLVMRAPIELYPPSVYQAELLEEEGFEVAVLDTEDGAPAACQLRPSIRRIVLEKTRGPATTRQLLHRIGAPFRRQLFKTRAVHWLKRLCPDVVISYEPPAIAAIGSDAVRDKTVRVWHLHEYPELCADLGIGTRRSIGWVWKNASEADAIWFPDANRAELFAKSVAPIPTVEIIRNFPRVLANVPSPCLRTLLRQQHVVDRGFLVLYCGSVGADHGLETTIQGMGQWPIASLFVLVGPCAPAFRSKLLGIAHKFGVADRVVFVGAAAPDTLWSIRASADVAVTISEPRSINYKLHAGASNKRFETMAVGVPQVTNGGTGLTEIIEGNGIGICVPHDQPEAIGRAIAQLLMNENLRREMGNRARRLHLQRFNYETEFKPVLERLVESIRDRRNERQTTRGRPLCAGLPDT